MDATMDVPQDRETERARARRRRNQLARAEGKAYRLATIRCPGPEFVFHGCTSWDSVFAMRARFVRQHYRNRKPCSCYRCGNFRRNLKGRDHLTLQELKAMDPPTEA